MRRPPGRTHDVSSKERHREHEEEPPPLLGSWTAWYAFVLISLLFWIGAFYLFTRVFGK